ncbi:alpha/beta hydrolase [Streptomyces sp. NPDC005538]|uniref:alpha/beta hydrolase n=1 Tax=unclassified Streptomyces TaxID=2593676 RepID=UPI0033B3559D
MRIAGEQPPVPQLSAPPPDTPSTLPPPTAGDDGTRVHRDIVYANEIGYRPLRMDLMVPAGAGPVPVVLWLHGGGFLMGSRRRSALAGPPWDALLARRIAVAVVEYRFAFEERFPACVHDVKAAVRWLRRHGPGLGLLPDVIGAWGESAGGYLSAFLALDGRQRALEGEVGVTGPSSEVRAAVAWYPPTDFLAMDAQAEGARSIHPHDDPGSPESLLIGGPLQKNPDAARAASPLNYVASSGPAPLLLMHGTLDPYVPYRQSVVLAEAMAAGGAPVTLQLVDGAGHMFEGVDQGPLIERAVAFLADHLM